MNWYVQVENQAYGPYTEVQMQNFVAEGRVNNNSLISNTPQQGFFAAVGYDIFSLWSGTGQPVAVSNGLNTYQQQTQQPVQYTAAAEQQNPAQNATQNQRPAQYTASMEQQNLAPEQIQTPAVYELNAHQIINPQAFEQSTPDLKTDTSIYLVMAEIQSEGAMNFLKALQSFGIAQRIGDTVWLLRSAFAVEKVRNTLSQSLNRQDRLFILDATHNKTAWFNIGADLDHRIRELWSEDDE